MPDERREAVGLLAEALTEARTVSDTVDQIVQFAAANLGTPFGGITLIRGHGLETVGATNAAVEQADALQHELKEGPCVDAAMLVRGVSSDELATDARWPRWGPAAAQLGLHSILSTELHARGQRIGALNIYGGEASKFDQDDAALARVFAHQGAVALAAVRSEQGLLSALESRSLIGQAQGILMERFEIDADQSFSVLRRYSQDANVRLVEVARRLTEHREI